MAHLTPSHTNRFDDTGRPTQIPNWAWVAGDRLRIKAYAFPDGAGRLFNGRTGIVSDVGTLYGLPFVVADLDRARGGLEPRRGVYLPQSSIEPV